MMTILLILGNVSINDSNNDTLSEKLLSDYEPKEMQLELEAVEPMAEEQQNHLEAQKENQVIWNLRRSNKFTWSAGA